MGCRTVAQGRVGAEAGTFPNRRRPTEGLAESADNVPGGAYLLRGFLGALQCDGEVVHIVIKEMGFLAF